jgi:hypothetical protein
MGYGEELSYKAVVFKTKGSKVPRVYNIGKNQNDVLIRIAGYAID